MYRPASGVTLQVTVESTGYHFTAGWPSSRWVVFYVVARSHARRCQLLFPQRHDSYSFRRRFSSLTVVVLLALRCAELDVGVHYVI